MAITKPNGFNAPYRSLSFREMMDTLVQRNGLLSLSAPITTFGGVVTVPPFSAMQNGLEVVSDSTKTVNVPPTLAAPYFLTASWPTASNTDDTILGFAKAPRDVVATEVIIAEWDGTEWHAIELISNNEIVKAAWQSKVDRGLVGPDSGLTSSIASNTVTVAPGVIDDRLGQTRRVLAAHTFPQLAADPDYSRVDRMVWRRPIDSPYRIGRLEYLTGGAYGSSPTLHDTQLIGSSAVNNDTKVIIAPDNSAHLFVAEGYGTSFSIQYAKLNTTRTALSVAVMSIATATAEYFSVTQDSLGNLYVAFVNGANIQVQALTSLGAAIGGPHTIVTGGINLASQPKIVIDYLDNLYVVYTQLMGPSNNQLFLASFTTGLAVITSPVRINNDANNYTEPSVFINEDLLIYLSYTNLTSGQIQYEVRDTFGISIASPVVVSNATSGGGYGTLNGSASRSFIRVSDNKTLFITFLQVKSGSLKGLAIYTNGAATLIDLISSPENFTTYSVAMDSTTNSLQLCLAQSGTVDYILWEAGAVVNHVNLYASGGSFVTVVKDELGALLHLVSSNLTGTFTNYGGANTIGYIGPTSVVGSMSTVVLTSSQFLMNSGVSFNVGDQITFAGSAHGNNGTYLITAGSLVSLNSSNDFNRITVASVFSSAENPAVGVTGQLAAPDGNQVRYIKSVADTTARAFRTTVLPTDVLLSRFDGNTVLNYTNVTVESTLSSDNFAMHGAAVVDWSKTVASNFTFSGELNITDLVNNLDYALVAGSYPMSSGQAIYVELNGVNLTPTPIVANISDLPFGDAMLVLGFVADGRFNPAFLAKGNVKPMDSGEQNTVGQDLPIAIRARLGITSETSFEAYASTESISTGETYPEAISSLDAREDVVRKVQLIDLVSTTLPTGASPSVDGVAVANGDYVLFATTALNKVYVASGIGTSVVWTAKAIWGASTTPVVGAMARVKAGTSYAATLWSLYTSGWKPLESMDAQVSPTGMVDDTQSTISFVDGTRTFSLTPTGSYFDYYISGQLYRINATKTVVIPNADGLYYIYFDTTGTLTASLTEPDESLFVMVSEVLWSVSDAKGDIVSDERHTVRIDPSSREFMHDVLGTRLLSGASITYTLGTDGSTDAQAEIGLSNAVIRDEDLVFNITHSATPTPPFQQVLFPIAKIPVFYLDTTGVWRKTTSSNFPVKTGTARIAYNLFSGGNWTTPDASEGFFVPMFLYATNNILEPIIAVLGQSQYSTLAAAQTGALVTGLTFGSMITPELKLLYRAIFKTSSTYTNTPKAYLAEVVDLRAVADSVVAATSVSEHNNLSGRDAPAAHPASSIATVTTAFNRILNSSDTDVQLSLNSVDAEINKFFGQFRIQPRVGFPTQVTVTGVDYTMLDNSVLSQTLSNLIVNFTGAVIDFSTGSIFQSDGVTALGVNFTPFTIPASDYFWYSVGAVAASVGGDNRIALQMIILPATAAGTTALNAPYAGFSTGGKSIGQVQVQNSGGSIVINTIRQLGVGSGSGSGGSGSGSPLDPDQESNFVYYTRSDFSVDGSTFFGSVTGAINNILAQGVINFTAGGQIFQSLDLTGPTIKDDDLFINVAQARLRYSTSSIDTSPTVQISIDGGNTFTTATVSRLSADGDQLLATVNFSAGTNYSGDGTHGSPFSAQGLAFLYTPLYNQIVNSTDLFLGTASISGTAVGKIYATAAGIPTGAALRQSSETKTLGVDVNSTSAFSRFTFAPITLLAGVTYAFACEATTGQTVKTDIVTATGAQNSGSSTWNGTSWTTSANNDAFIVYGSGVDLRLKVTSSAASSFLGFGMDYVLSNPSVTSGAVNNFEQHVITSAEATSGLISLVQVTYVPGLHQLVALYTNLTFLAPDFAELNPTQVQFPANYLVAGNTIRFVLLNGVIESSAVSLNRLAVLYDAIVGSVTQKNNGSAGYSSLASAITAFPNGTILLLKGYNTNEAITIPSTGLTIEGQGYNTQIPGTVTLSSAQFCTIKNLRFNGNLSLQSGSTGNFIRDCFLAPTATISDSGSANSKLLVVG